MKQSLLFLLIFFSVNLSAQHITLRTNSIINRITKVNQLDYERIGVTGETSDQYLNFEELKTTATIKELLELLKHKNPVVKGYACWSLVDNKYDNLKEILIQFLNTGEKVNTQNGCNVSSEELSTELYFRVKNQGFYNKLTVKNILFFKNQCKILDKILYNSGKENIALIFALQNNNANPENYTIIRKLSLQKKNSYALIELAKYHKTIDIESIKKEGKEAFEAISYFPNPGFWNLLMKYNGKEMTLDYFQAVASFKNEASLKSLYANYTMLKKTKSIKSIEMLDEALIKQFSPIYKNLIFLIFEDFKTIDYTMTKRLLAEDPQVATKHFVKGLLGNLDYNYLEIDDNYGAKDSILPLMLDNIKKYQFDKLGIICKKNILNAQFTELTSFLGIIKQYKITECKGLLLSRLKMKNFPFEIYHLSATLLSFNDQQANIKLIIELRKTKKDWNSGNWADSFSELFKEYKIRV